MISFRVEGIARPQGSKRHVGGGRMIESSKHVAAWRDWVRMRAVEAMAGRKPLERGIVVEAYFGFVRPQSHFNASGLKSTAPRYPSSRPDVDKLLRAALDAMTGIVFLDDSQVVSIGGHKVYVSAANSQFEIHEADNDRT